MKLGGIILCQLYVLVRVFSEAKGMGLLLRRGADLLFKLVEILSVATSPPKYQRGLPGILCSHSIAKEMNELRGLWKDLLLFWKCGNLLA